MALPVEARQMLDAMSGDARDMMESFLKGMEEPVALHPDLEEYLVDTNIGPCIKHPLYFSMMHAAFQNGRANEVYQAKCEYAEELLREPNYSGYVWLHERPYRIGAFMEISYLLKDRRYWSLLGDIWIDSENIFQSYALWKMALLSDRGQSWALMRKPEDRQWLRNAQRRKRRTLLIYRGFSRFSQGMSWTLDRNMADWFARRWLGADGRERARVAIGTVDARDVIAHFTVKGESEILVPYDSVDIAEIVNLRSQP